MKFVWGMYYLQDDARTKRVKQKISRIVAVLWLLVMVLSMNALGNFEWTKHVREKLSSGTRKLNVLTLGGSITWGAAIENRMDAYPFQLMSLHNMHVTNLAIRGTGSSYPAQCISSMLRDKGQEETSFDVILLEFSINGVQAFELLFHRLKERYPNALFIYVNLFSMKLGQTGKGVEEGLQVVSNGGGYVYNFPNKGDPTADFDYRTIWNTDKPVELYPESEILTLFHDDKHHLSPLGHSMVAKKVIEIITQHDYLFSEGPLKVGSWLGGDQCMTWYETGELSSMAQIVEGGKMNQWDVAKNKWAIEVHLDGMIMRYDHESDKEAPFQFVHMTKCLESRYPSTSIYSPVIVRVENDLALIKKAKQQAINGEVEMKFRDFAHLESIAEGWTYIMNLSKGGFRKNHIQSITYAGILKPGPNFIYIYPLLKKRDENGNFRVTGTIICEACGRLGWNSDIW